MKVYGSINTEAGSEISTTPAMPTISSNALTIDCSTANIFVVAHDDDITTLTVSNQQDGQTIAIILNEVGSGNTISWPVDFFFLGSSSLDSVDGQINLLWATYSATLAYWVAAIESNNGVGAGTVTSVALADGSSTPIFSISGSPVTTSGTLTFTLSTKTANKVFAGPSTGSPAQPTFRSLVYSDLPAIAYEEQVATASQTVFNTSTVTTLANTGTQTYLEVFVNGVYQQQGATKAYTVTGSNQITFNDGLSINSDVVFVAFA